MVSRMFKVYCSIVLRSLGSSFQQLRKLSRPTVLWKYLERPALSRLVSSRTGFEIQVVTGVKWGSGTSVLKLAHSCLCEYSLCFVIIHDIMNSSFLVLVAVSLGLWLQRWNTAWGYQVTHGVKWLRDGIKHLPPLALRLKSRDISSTSPVYLSGRFQGEF